MFASGEEKHMAHPGRIGMPLVIDVDGTLIKSDLLVESAFKLVKQSPWAIVWMVRWMLSGGKALLKSRIADRVELDIGHMPFCAEIVALCGQARRQGRRVVLATGAAMKYAQQIARLMPVDSVMATTERNNLTGDRKLQAILGECAQGEFVYAGNETVDLEIWRCAGSAVVCGNARLAAAAAKVSTVQAHIRPRRVGLAVLAKTLRMHQWAKNVLIFLPFVPLVGQLDANAWLLGVVAFIAFGLCASSAYLLNDLFDLEADRVHARKSKRPIAAGDISLSSAALLSLGLLATSFLISALLLPPLFVAVLGAYWALTMAYSLDLKKRVNVDVIVLACLYTARVLAGAAVLGVQPSFWMLAFAVFLFLSLAAAKRTTELDALARSGNEDSAAGRGYQTRDIPVLLAQGAASGQLAVLVFALYLNTELSGQFRHPEWLWAVCPLLLLWINRVWMKVTRGEMHDDPVVFALRDSFSRATALVAVACVTIAALV
jgi:4-hydroxybenzoate polyprenyltransferase/phosphoserine phosphatase